MVCKKRGTVHFLVMENVLYSTLPIHKRFDLKGSKLGRAATQEEKEQLCPVLKDHDFDSIFLQLGVDRQAFMDQITADAKFLASLSIMDYSLLVGIHLKETHNNDDLSHYYKNQTYYGLTMSTRVSKKDHLKEDKQKPESLQTPQFQPSKLHPFNEDEGGMCSRYDDGKEGSEIYYFGIIDILTKYNLKKMTEHSFKSLFTHKQDEMSCVNPELYSTRFCKFLFDHTH